MKLLLFPQIDYFLLMKEKVLGIILIDDDSNIEKITWGLQVLKLDKKYSGIIAALFMTLVLDTTMTFTMTSINTGWIAGFLQRFLQSWIIGFAVAFPTSLITIPLARRLSSSLTSEQN